MVFYNMRRNIEHFNESIVSEHINDLVGSYRAVGLVGTRSDVFVMSCCFAVLLLLHDL